MTFLAAFLLFIAVAVGVSLVGMKLWVRPKEAIERVTGTAVPSGEHFPLHPSLAFHQLVQKVGSLLPASPKDVSLVQRQLIRAGFRSPNALRILYGARVLLAVVLALAASLAAARSPAESSNKAVMVLGAAAVGFFGPNEYVKRAARRRQRRLRRGLPNALDLMVVCVESGLGLDQAIVQVAKELEHAHPEICEELTLVSLELKAGKRRAESLRNLAERSSVEDLKKLVAVLIQADRFGTGIAQSLRGHADFMRVQARQVAEEKAAKLGVKLVFPIFFCILPSLFVVTVGPMVVRIMRDLLPMMNNM